MWWIGTSGWQYADWRGRLYPEGLPQTRWLERVTELLSTVELNVSFYRLPQRSAFEQWAARTPAATLFAAKMSRYLTHIRRLAEPREPVERFLSRATGLGNKLGPVLLQLPPTLPADAGLLDAALSAFPRHIRVVLEPRHESWWAPAIREVLTARGAALCWADRGSRPVTPLWRTADFGYLRMHSGAARPRPRYGRRAIDSWVDRLREAYPDGEDVFVYFNNDQHGAAVDDALALQARAHRLALPVRR